MPDLIFQKCPICDLDLDGCVFKHYCPEGHYEYSMASNCAAAFVTITVDGHRENFFLDDNRLDDTQKLERRIEELRTLLRADWIKQGF